MQEAQLSPAATKALTRLRRKYQVEFNPYKLRGRQLRLLQVSDLESVLGGRDPFSDISGFPYWIKVWEAALVLADFMAAQPPEPDGRILELGAGLGLPDLAAAAAGHRVTLSDYAAHILDFQRVSAAANGVADRVEHLRLDWFKPPELPRFTTIIGAEILFREDFFDPLLAIMTQCLAPGGSIYLAHDVRRQSLPRFLALAEKNFTVAISRRRMQGDDSEQTIILSRLQRHGH